jgi:hypothetical protein
MENANDNFELPFTQIGLAAALVLNRLRNNLQISSFQKQEIDKRSSETDTGNAGDKERADHKEYVDRRLRDLAAFEKRANGK